MRSWRSVAIATWVVYWSACGTDAVPQAGDDGLPPTDPDVCETSYLTYDTFGAGFSANWCRGCHSSTVPEAGRQMAPLGVNFDTEADVLHWQTRIRARATGDAPTMPPAGGPNVAERQQLAEWIDCGMK